MIRLVADTPALLWWLYDDRRLSAAAAWAMDAVVQACDQIGVSTIVLAEILFLGERGRLNDDALVRVAEAIERPGGVFREIPFDRHFVRSMAAIARADVPELPDRIIAATARHHQVPLITRDARIRASGVTTIW